MEQVLYRLHVKILTTTNQFVGYEVRRIMEFACLIVAICSLFTLFLLHSTYVINSSSPKFNCLLNAIESFEVYSWIDGLPSQENIELHHIDQILHGYRNRTTSPYNLYAIKIQGKDLSPPPGKVKRSINEESNETNREKMTQDGLLSSVFDNMYDNSHFAHPNNVCDLFKNANSDEHQHHMNCYQYPSRFPATFPSAVTIARPQNDDLSNFSINSTDDVTHASESAAPSTRSAIDRKYANPLPEIVSMNISINQDDFLEIRSFSISAKELQQRSTEYHYLFSFDRAVLMLSQEIHLSNPDYQFTLLEVEMHRASKCFGPKITNRFVDLSKSLDVVIMNWVISTFDGQGFLYNAITKELLNLNYAKQLIAKKGIQLHEMGRRESFQKSNSNNYLNIYLKLMKQLITWWNQHTLFSPLLVWIAEYLDGMFELLVEALRSTTLFQLLLKQLDGLGSTGSSEILSSKIVDIIQQYILFRLGVVCSTLFLFFISSTLVSYILRETQERMIRFTFLLQYHVAHQLSITSLIFTHVTESLVFVPIMMGIYFFLFEFFSDQLLAFLVLLVVWIAEVFSILSLRSKVSIEYFPRIFFYYFTLFHIYFFSYPFGFVYLGLFTDFVFLFHSIMHFWNVYEVPAMESGSLSPQHPRIGRPVGRSVATAGPTLVVGGMGGSNTGTRSSSVVHSPARTRAPSINAGASSTTAQTESSQSTQTPQRRASGNTTESQQENGNITDLLGRAVQRMFSGNTTTQPPTTASTQRTTTTTSRYVIQLPNVDVTRNQFIAAAPSLPVGRQRRSGTENDLSPALPSIQAPSSASSHSANSSAKSTPVDVGSPVLTSSTLHAHVSTVGVGPQRPRSTSSVSVGSVGSSGSATGNNSMWRPNVYESLELRKMRLEQEKLKYNINHPPPPHHPSYHAAPTPAAQVPPSPSQHSNHSSSPSSPTTGNELLTSVTLRKTMSMPPTISHTTTNSGSQLSMVTPSSGISSEVSSPNNDNRVTFEFPKLENQSNQVISSAFKPERKVVSKDDLIGFFLEEDEEAEEVVGEKSGDRTDRNSLDMSVTDEGEEDNNQMKNVNDQISKKESSGMNKNYSFNVFGDVFDEDD